MINIEFDVARQRLRKVTHARVDPCSDVMHAPSMAISSHDAVTYLSNVRVQTMCGYNFMIIDNILEYPI